MTAIYAFCRVVDDLVDRDVSAREKQADLDWWRRQLTDRHFPRHLLMQELAWAMETFAIPMRYLLELIDGVARDITPAPLQTIDDLLQYCYGVAGTVGLLCLPIFGVHETPDARAAAIALGNAFQLTNILRDVRTDALHHRIYLPMEDLQRFGVAPESFKQLPTAAMRDRVMRLLQFEAERAEAFFAEAWRQFPMEPVGNLKPARIMSMCYHAILRQIRRDPLQVFRGRVRIPWWKKAHVALLAC